MYPEGHVSSLNKSNPTNQHTCMLVFPWLVSEQLHISHVFIDWKHVIICGFSLLLLYILFNPFWAELFQET